MSGRTALRMSIVYGLGWLSLLAVPMLTGHTEVICATPFGLLLALAAGTGVAAVPRGSVRTIAYWRLADAALAGALVGAFQGLSAAILVPLLLDRRFGSRGWGDILGTVLLVVGSTAGMAVLGAAFGLLGYACRRYGQGQRRRRDREDAG